MLKKTKIIATISDKRCDVTFLRELFEAGMNVVRLNSAHLDEDGFLKIINNTREVSNRIAILVDTKGPEIRTTVAENPIDLKTGDQVKIVGNPAGISTQEATKHMNSPAITAGKDVRYSVLISCLFFSSTCRLISSKFASAHLSYDSAIILSPDRSSLTLIFRSSHSSSMIPESGSDFPVSHFDTARSLIPSFSARTA